MFDAVHPTYTPIVLPADQPALLDSGQWESLLLSTAYAVRPGRRELWQLSRQRTRRLLVDPMTAHYQYEGYMSAEDLRSVAYSPGRGTLGSLWQPRDFASHERRGELIDSVIGVQRELDADLLLAPYFLVSDVDHPWLGLAADIAGEALARGADRPLGVVVCVEIDALLGPGRLETVIEAFGALRPELWMLIVVNHDELEASPQEMEVVLRLIDHLGAGGTPVLQAFAGRGGLVAAASGACGYAAGALELEAHPKRYYREGLINLHANTFYLPGAMVRLPVRLAEAVSQARPDARGADGDDVAITRMVARHRAGAALRAKRAEAEALAALPPGDRLEYLRQRFDTALEICVSAQRILAEQGGPEQLDNGQYHYLEVLRQMVGGVAATIPDTAGF